MSRVNGAIPVSNYDGAGMGELGWRVYVDGRSPHMRSNLRRKYQPPVSDLRLHRSERIEGVLVPYTRGRELMDWEWDEMPRLGLQCGSSRN